MSTVDSPARAPRSGRARRGRPARPPVRRRGFVADPARHEVLAVPLRRAVLRLFAIFGALPDRLHVLDVAARLGRWAATGTFVGLRELHRTARRRALLELGLQHVRHLRHRHRPAAAAGAVPGQRAQPAAAGPRTFFRMAMLVPNITSIAAVAIVFGQLFDRDFGVVNWVLGLVGVGPDRLAGHQVGVLDRHLHDGRLALDRLQRADLPGRDAGHPADLYESAAIDGASAVAAVLDDHRADAAADDHLRGDHLDHRRPAALRRAADVQLRRRQRHRRHAARSSRPCTMYMFENMFTALQLSATAPRSPGCCS